MIVMTMTTPMSMTRRTRKRPSNGREEVAMGATVPRMRAVLVAIVVAVVAVGHFFAFQPARAGTTSFWALAIVPTLVLAAVAVARAARDGELREWLTPKWGDATAGVLAAGAILAGAWAFTRF